MVPVSQHASLTPLGVCRGKKHVETSVCFVATITAVGINLLRYVVSMLLLNTGALLAQYLDALNISCMVVSLNEPPGGYIRFEALSHSILVTSYQW